MHTHHLTENMAEPSRDVERSEVAAITSEIAVRFIELNERQFGPDAILLILRLADIARMNPEAIWVVMNLFTGDLTEATRSYKSIGKDEYMTKQAVEQKRWRAVEEIGFIFPELAYSITQIRAMHHTPEEENQNDH